MPSAALAMTLSTVRIHALGPAGEAVGTGYFYNFPAEEAGTFILALITNKHVIDGFDRINVSLQIMPKGAQPRPDGTVEGEKRFEATLQLEGLVLRHPDPNVDLCAILVFLLEHHLPPGMVLKHAVLDSSVRLTKAEAENLRPIEPITMIGYPNGLWDEVNNKPIARRGLTASHPLHNWNGQRYFVIDAACYGGSSGSPVFLYEDGMVRTGANGYGAGTRCRLLGTLWGGPTVTAQGELVPRTIPTHATIIPQVSLMMNLGYVVKADAIDDLATMAKEWVANAIAARPPV